MGKARTPFTASDLMKSSLLQNTSNYGVSRVGYQGTTEDRGTSAGSALVDPNSNFKLDTRGGLMKGSLGFKGEATDELTTTGILDTKEYNLPRLYITNTTLYTLKVLIPTLGDGQELWIRANAAVSFTIQHTSGTGSETTGNIELLQGTDYTMTGDDWICFHYDQTDDKFHQVSAGKNDVG